MTWLHHHEMADVHILRQDTARARFEYEADQTPEKAAALAEATGRRNRAIRAIHREDGTSVKHLAGMFKISKSVVRSVLAEEEE